MNRQHLEWPFYGREAIVAELTDALENNRLGGAAIVGPSGIGKTAIAQQVLKRLHSDAYVLQIRGSSATARIPYGALNILLSELEPNLLENPVMVLTGLMKALRERADGRRIILFVDNATEVDALAASVIAQLVRSGTAAMLMASSDLSATEVDLLALWKDGFLHRVDVPPLTLAEATDWMRAGLDSMVSRSAARSLWTTSEGNPLFLVMLARERMDSRVLRKEGDVWVLATSNFDHGSELTELLAARIARLTPAQRRVMEIIALADSITLEALTSLAEPEDIDMLEERGNLDIDHDEPYMVRLRSNLMAEVVRSHVPPGRSRELREEVMEAVGYKGPHPMAMLSYVAWTMDCGADLAPETALAAARLANSQVEPRAALRFLGAINDRFNYPGAVLEEVTALMSLGDNEAALKVLGQYHKRPHNEPSLTDWVGLMLAEGSILFSQPDSWREAASILEKVRVELYPPGADVPPVPEHELRELRTRLAVGEAEALTYSGDYSEAVGRLRELHADVANDADFRLLIGGVLAEALAATGRQLDGANLADQLLERADDPDISITSREVTIPRLYYTYLLAGMWDKCSDLFNAMRSEAHTPKTHMGMVTELPEALIHIHAGRAHDALELLLPAVSQLRVVDNEGSLSVATAATAFAYGVLEEPEKARAYLREIEHHPRRSTWRVRRRTGYFRALTWAEIDSKDKAVKELVRLADEDNANGTRGQELFALAAAARLGGADLGVRLAETAALCQGPFAELCTAFGQGIAQRDAALLVDASRRAAAMGNDLFAYDAAQAASEVASESSDKQHQRLARHVGDMSKQRLSGAAKGTGAAAALTARELEVARMALAGLSNKVIAQRMHVSVRTVEGHLYQIFGKLQISGRAELKVAMQEATLA